MTNPYDSPQTRLDPCAPRRVRRRFLRALAGAIGGAIGASLTSLVFSRGITITLPTVARETEDGVLLVQSQFWFDGPALSLLLIVVGAAVGAGIGWRLGRASERR